MSAPQIVQDEPVIVGQLSALIVTGAAVLTAFGIGVTQEQITALVAFVGPVTSIIAAVWARHRVSPT